MCLTLDSIFTKSDLPSCSPLEPVVRSLLEWKMKEKLYRGTFSL